MTYEITISGRFVLVTRSDGASWTFNSLEAAARQAEDFPAAIGAKIEAARAAAAQA